MTIKKGEETSQKKKKPTNKNRTNSSQKLKVTYLKAPAIMFRKTGSSFTDFSSCLKIKRNH